MVLGVCRRILHHPDDADDAFQATYLVLLRKACSLRRPEQLGPWLYGVSYRTALHARTSRRRHQARQRQVPDMPAAEPPPDPAWRDLRLVLDAEIARLPEKYRVPFVLCYLEGQTYDTIGRRLGCPLGTVSTRLTRARALLRERLTRRGVVLSVAVLTTLLTEQATAAVPTALVVDTVAAAVLVVGGAAGVVPAPVAALTEGVIPTMFLTQMKTVTTLLVVATLVRSSGVLAYRSTAADPSDGRRLVAGSADGTLRLWDPVSGKSIAVRPQKAGGGGRAAGLTGQRMRLPTPPAKPVGGLGPVFVLRPLAAFGR